MQGGRRTEQIEDIYDTGDQCMFGRKTHKTDLNTAHANTHTHTSLQGFIT